jgi:hypothetical protein
MEYQHHVPTVEGVATMLHNAVVCLLPVMEIA